jgi:hypothetical protein
VIAMPERTDVAEWLRAQLADGAVPAADMLARAKAAGISDRTLTRARIRAGVKAVKAGFTGTGWIWTLSNEPTASGVTPAEPRAAAR